MTLPEIVADIAEFVETADRCGASNARKGYDIGEWRVILAALRSSPSEQRDAKRTRECSCVSTCYKAAGERLGDNWHCRVELPIIGLFAGSRVDEVIDAFLAEAAIAASGGAKGDGNG